MKKVKINGLEYYERFPKWKLPFFRLTKWIQKQLWIRGVHWHDWIFGECTPDFSCCMKKVQP